MTDECEGNGIFGKVEVFAKLLVGSEASENYLNDRP